MVLCCLIRIRAPVSKLENSRNSSSCRRLLNRTVHIPSGNLVMGPYACDFPPRLINWSAGTPHRIRRGPQCHCLLLPPVSPDSSPVPAVLSHASPRAPTPYPALSLFPPLSPSIPFPIGRQCALDNSLFQLPTGRLPSGRPGFPMENEPSPDAASVRKKYMAQSRQQEQTDLNSDIGYWKH